MKTTTLPLRNLINCSPLCAFLLIPFVLACFALSPQARAGCRKGCVTGNNTLFGDNALFSNTTGSQNTAIGFQALFANTTGSFNTATGTAALESNTTGFDNTGFGESTLFGNSTGIQNTAIGAFALTRMTAGDNNTATGSNALALNETGGGNTANGFNALLNNTTGSFNTALGNNAGANLTTGSNNIDIGNRGVSGESNTIRIGTGENSSATFIAGISGATVPTGVEVIINTNGRLGTITSSARFKDEIKPMDSEAILALKPVTFHYKKDLDPAGIPQFGLVAEDVEKVNPDLVARDEQGKLYTVRYEAVNAMLLNEFLKEHRKVEEQGTTIAKQQKQIEALTAGLQKVSAQLEASKPAPEIVVVNQ